MDSALTAARASPVQRPAAPAPCSSQTQLRSSSSKIRHSSELFLAINTKQYVSTPSVMTMQLQHSSSICTHRSELSICPSTLVSTELDPKLVHSAHARLTVRQAETEGFTVCSATPHLPAASDGTVPHAPGPLASSASQGQPQLQDRREASAINTTAGECGCKTAARLTFHPSTWMVTRLTHRHPGLPGGHTSHSHISQVNTHTSYSPSSRASRWLTLIPVRRAEVNSPPRPPPVMPVSSCIS